LDCNKNGKKPRKEERKWQLAKDMFYKYINLFCYFKSIFLIRLFFQPQFIKGIYRKLGLFT